LKHKGLGLKGVYRSQNGKHWMWKPYINKEDRKRYPHIRTDDRGYASTIVLGKTGDPLHKIHAAYAEELKQLFREDDYLTLNWLFREYTACPAFRKLATATQRRYIGAGTRLLAHTVKVNGASTPLGKLYCKELTRPTLRRILDKRKVNYSVSGSDPFSGNSELNNEIAVLAGMYQHGMDYYEEINVLVKRPTDGIKKFPIRQRKHNVTANDYRIMYQVAVETSPPYLTIVMELARFLAARGIEVSDLQVSDRKELPDGYAIEVGRRKGSKTTTIRCNEELNAAWDAAIKLHRITPIGTSPLLIGKGGHPVTRNAITKAWQNLKTEMENKGLADHYFWLHDLKKWGVTHSVDKAIAGQSLQMQELYNLEDQIKVYDPPKPKKE
jgi:hypothetical protein